MWTTGNGLIDATLIVLGILSVGMVLVVCCLACGWLCDRHAERHCRFWLDLDDGRIDFDDLV